MMNQEKPVLTIDDFKSLMGKKDGIPDDQVSDYAVAALGVMRGLSRGDKLKVLRRMQRMLGSQAGRRRV